MGFRRKTLVAQYVAYAAEVHECEHCVGFAGAGRLVVLVAVGGENLVGKGLWGTDCRRLCWVSWHKQVGCKGSKGMATENRDLVASGRDCKGKGADLVGCSIVVVLLDW